jgi:hypothetical protein
MVEAFQQMPELARVAVDPFLPVRSKANIVNAVLKDSGATEITKRLFGETARRSALHHTVWHAAAAYCIDWRAPPADTVLHSLSPVYRPTQRRSRRRMRWQQRCRWSRRLTS